MFSKKDTKIIKDFIRATFGDRVTPHDLLEAARPKKSPIHYLFEWDDSVAAEHYRLEQAREIIRSVHVTYENKPVREFHNVIVKKQHVYLHRDSVEKSQSLLNQVFVNAIKELIYWRERNRRFDEFSDIITQIDILEKKHVKGNGQDSAAKTRQSKTHN